MSVSAPFTLSEVDGERLTAQQRSGAVVVPTDQRIGGKIGVSL